MSSNMVPAQSRGKRKADMDLLMESNGMNDNEHRSQDITDKMSERKIVMGS